MLDRLLTLSALIAVIFISACAAPPARPEPPKPPELTYEQKMAWILRLEEDRVLAREPIQPAPAANPDLVSLMRDGEARIRRRAALAAGRTRLPAAIGPLAALLSSDADPEVRQMAGFALGLIGDASAADALVAALADPDPIVHGRAAEALGLISHKAAAGAIAAMMAGHVKAGALADIPPDDLDHPKAPPAEAVRLGAYALVRLGSYEGLAAALTDGSGQPASRWWPIAYAFQRVGNAQAAPVLVTLLQGQGAMTRAFAARGLGGLKDQRAAAPLLALLAKADEPIAVRIQSARALAAIGSRDAVKPLVAIVTATKLNPNLRLESLNALGLLSPPEVADLFVELLTAAWPSLRAAAVNALARTDPDMFMAALSGMDPDPHWSVRAAIATALGSLGAERAAARLNVMLSDDDQRVLPAVLSSLVEVNAPGVEEILIKRLVVDDPVVRMAAVNGLARLKTPRAVEPLVAAYEVSERDPTYVARAAILAALAELDRNAARPLLDRALADRDWAIRVRAAALLRGIDPAVDTASRIRPAPASAAPDVNDVAPLIAPPVSPTAYIDTEKGMIQIELAVLDAPRTVANFISMARRNFLGGTPFHRVVPDFVAQDGDPRGDGEGGPGYTIRDEINQRPYLRGTVGMALDWEDTGGSQFFITHSPQPHLDARYTVFGRVITGMEVVDQLQQWDQIRTVRIWDGQNWIGPRN